jgi:hypothetical protein
VDAALRDGGSFADPVVAGPGGDDLSVTGHRFPSARAGAVVPRSDTDQPVDQPGTAGTVASPVAVPVGSDAALRPAPDRTLPAETDWADLDRADLDRADLDRADVDRSDLDAFGADAATPGQPGPDVVDSDEHTPTASNSADQADKLPGTVPAPELGPLFADPDAHAFRDRWRDVQLRFVDDPKAAAAEAAGLVDEVVEALSASLKKQREQIAGAAGQDSGDTEQLRVRLRSYRDFLDHLLSL